MIKRLRRKFILLALVTVFIILSLIITIINIRNYSTVRNDADNYLTILYEAGGSFDKNFIPNNNTSQSNIESDASYKGFNPRGTTPNDEFNDRIDTMSYDRMMSMVTFFVKKTGNTYNFYKSRNVYTIDQETAIAMFDAVSNGGYERGYVDRYYRYYNTYDEATQTRMVIFLDCTETISSARSFLKSSIIISAIGLLAFLAIIIVASRFIFKPVEEAYEKQKRFIANAGHELKTPLTIISANNEVEEMIVGENEQTVAISKQVSKLTGMVNSLTKLALLEENYKLEKVEEFKITDSILDVLDSYNFKIEERNLVLETNLIPDAIYKGDEGLIKVLVSILMDNAIKYSISKIDVSLKKAGNKLEFSVSNDAKNQKLGAHPEVFERFYRTDDVRASQVQGSGIGLSIAKEIVDVHKGKIEALSTNELFIIKVVI